MTKEETQVGLTKKGQSDDKGRDTDGDDSRGDRVMTQEETDGDDSRGDRVMTQEETQMVMTVEVTE